MKRLSFLLLAIIALLLAACSGDPAIDLTPPEEESGAIFESVSDSITRSGPDFVAETMGNEHLAMLVSLVLPKPLAEVRVDAIRYYTNDPAEKKILASGIVVYPVTGEIRGVILAAHGTIGASREAPSEKMNDWMSLLALAGYMVVSPDFIGYGVSKELVHPYLHAKLTASASIDMLLAVREYMERRGTPIQTPSISVIGYSQGGAAALAIQRLAEEKYAEEIDVIGVTAGGGPYNLSFFFEQMKRGNFMPSVFVPMTILGLNYGDNLGLNMANFFIDPLLSGYKNWIVSKDFTIGEISDRIGTNFLAPALFSDQPNADVQKLYESLADNDLTTGWTPRAPIRLIHGYMDTTVPISCAYQAYNTFTQRGCAVELRIMSSDHTGTILLFVIDILEQFT